MGKHKSEIKFDSDKRKEYLTGFKKRKDVRRKVAQDKIKQEIKDKRKDVVQERKKHNERIEEQYEQVQSLLKN
eukprot:403351249